MSNGALKILFVLIVFILGWKYLVVSNSPITRGANEPRQMSLSPAKALPEDVLIYSTSECQYCAQAKSWLNQNGYAFTECNMSIDSHCEREFRSFGATGTPYLIVRGHHMKDGFDSDEFLAALKQ